MGLIALIKLSQLVGQSKTARIVDSAIRKGAICAEQPQFDSPASEVRAALVEEP